MLYLKNTFMDFFGVRVDAAEQNCTMKVYGLYSK